MQKLKPTEVAQTAWVTGLLSASRFLSNLDSEAGKASISLGLRTKQGNWQCLYKVREERVLGAPMTDPVRKYQMPCAPH